MTGKQYQDTMKEITNRLSKAKVSVKKENEPLFQKFLADAKARNINVKSMTWKNLLICVFNLIMIPGTEDYTQEDLDIMLNVFENVDPKTSDAVKMKQVIQYANVITVLNDLHDVPGDAKESWEVINAIVLKVGECAGYEETVRKKGGKVSKKEDLKFEYFEYVGGKQEQNGVVYEEEENKINEEPPKEEENKISEEPLKNNIVMTSAEEKKYQEEKDAFFKTTAELNWDPKKDEKALSLYFRMKYAMEQIDPSKEKDKEKRSKLMAQKEEYLGFLDITVLSVPISPSSKLGQLKAFANYFKGTSMEEEYKDILREYEAEQEEAARKEAIIREQEEERRQKELQQREEKEREEETKRRLAKEKENEEREKQAFKERQEKWEAEKRAKVKENPEEKKEEEGAFAKFREEAERENRKRAEQEAREEEERRKKEQAKLDREKADQELFKNYQNGKLTRAQYDAAVKVAQEKIARMLNIRGGYNLGDYEEKAREAGIDADKPYMWSFLCSVCAVGSFQERNHDAPVSFQEVLNDLGEKGSLSGVGYFHMLRKISRSAMKNLDYMEPNDSNAAPLDYLNAPIKVGGKAVELDELIDFEIKYIEPELKKELEEKKKLLKKEEQERKEDEKEKQPKKKEEAIEPGGMLEADVPLEQDNRINEAPEGDKEKATEIAKNYDYLVAVRSDMRGQLLAMRDTLLNQGCKDKKGYAKMLADFNRKADAENLKEKDRKRKLEAAKAKFFAGDGTSYYRNMAKSLNVCIALLEEGDKGVDFDRMRKAFSELLDNVTEYRQVRTRLIHNTRFTEYGEARQETAKTLEKLINSFAVEYRYYSNELKALAGSHSIGGYEREAIEAKRQHGIETIVPDEVTMTDLHRVSAVRAEFVLKLERTCPEVAGLYKLYNTKADLNYYLSDKDNYPDSLSKKAGWYEAKKEYDRFFAPDLTGKQAEEMLRNFDVVAFKARINALKADRAFADVMNQYGNAAFTCWQGAERAVAGEGVVQVDSEVLYRRKINAARSARPKDRINLHQQVPGMARDLASPNIPDMTPHGKVQDIQSPNIPNMAYGRTKDIQSPL